MPLAKRHVLALGGAHWIDVLHAIIVNDSLVDTRNWDIYTIPRNESERIEGKI